MTGAPEGLKVEPRPPHGFVVTLRHTLPAGGIGWVLLLPLAAAAGVLGFLVLGDLSLPVAAVVVAAGIGLFLTVIGLLIRNQARQIGRDRVEVDGGTLRFHAMEGPVAWPLDAVKDVDVVPIGLSVRDLDGGTVHLALPKVPPESRAWLARRILDAVARHGRPDEVPQAIRAMDASRSRSRARDRA